jgi:hypothetical protein
MPQRMRERVEAQGRAREPVTKPNKYNNSPTTVDGIRFDSKKEARYYEQLKIRVSTGEVSYFLRQVAIYLPGGTRYVVDFQEHFVDPDRAIEYVDVKGRKTEAFLIKKREVEHHYPIKIRCV